jgi:xanthine dehydrogenase accessory factor
MKTADLIELSSELFQHREPHAWVTVVAVKGPSSAYVGAQAIVTADGRMHGWIGGGCVQSTAREAALRSLTSKTPQRLRLGNASDGSDDVDVRSMSCPSNGEIELFIHPVAVTPRLRIYGSTPVARAAAWLAREVDFDPLTDAEAADAHALANARAPADVQPLADTLARPEHELHSPASAIASEPQQGPGLLPETYALIATQGGGDEAALESALRSPARAVLVVGSKRKAERLRAAMALRGLPEARIATMRAPAGPDIGAVTPNEIALAAVAGLVALRRGRTESAGAPGDRVHDESGDGPHAAPPRGSSPRASAQRIVPGRREATGYVNPVCGAVIDPARALSSLSLGGQTHYFCCQSCRVEFERDPDKYLAIAAHMRAPSEMLE